MKRLFAFFTALALWTGLVVCTEAQSPQELLQRALVQIAAQNASDAGGWRAEGKVRTLYPLNNSGSVALMENGESFHVTLQVGGIVTESAYDATSGKGWRRQHGAILPIDGSEARQFGRLSARNVKTILLRGARGDLGVIDSGSATLPDGREARWLKVVFHDGMTWDIYLDAQGNLLAWGYYENDTFRRRPTRFVVIPSEWTAFGENVAPAQLKVYEDNRHSQTIHWEKVERVSVSAVSAMLKTPSYLPSPAGLPVTVPLRFFQRVIFVDALLNGRKYAMLLDTGAGITVIDKSAAQSLGLAPGANMNLLGAAGEGQASVTRLASLRIGGVELRDLQVAVTDLGLIRVLGGQSFGGIIGFNVLARFRMTVDYHRRTLVLERPGGALPPGHVVPAQFPGATPLLEMEVEDIGKVPMLLDTGASMTIIPVQASQQWQPHRAASLGLTLGVGGAGSVPRAARARTVQLAGETIEDMMLMFVPPSAAGAPVQILSDAGFGLLGNNLLRHFRLTIDYPMRTVVLQRLPKPASMGDAASTGIVLDLTADTAKVSGVMPLSSAWEQGIERGDEVLAVDGRSTKGAAPAEVQKWLTGEEGSSKRILLQRGAKRWEVRLGCRPMF